MSFKNNIWNRETKLLPQDIIDHLNNFPTSLISNIEYQSALLARHGGQRSLSRPRVVGTVQSAEARAVGQVLIFQSVFSRVCSFDFVFTRETIITAR